MSKYKLINKTTGTETLCEKVTIDGFDYYVSDEHPSTFKWKDFTICREELMQRASCCELCQKVIATNNPNIDIPKVVDEVERLANEFCKGKWEYSIEENKESFIQGYNKSQETHPNSDEDVIEFNVWQKSLLGSKNDHWLIEKSDKELLQLWKEQRPKIVYYG